MSVPSIERETVINFNDDEKNMIVYTGNSTLIKKLDNFCIQRPDLYTCIKSDNNFSFKTYSAPKKLVSFRVPKILSEAHKESMCTALKQAREK